MYLILKTCKLRFWLRNRSSNIILKIVLRVWCVSSLLIIFDRTISLVRFFLLFFHLRNLRNIKHHDHEIYLKSNWVCHNDHWDLCQHVSISLDRLKHHKRHINQTSTIFSLASDMSELFCKSRSSFQRMIRVRREISQRNYFRSRLRKSTTCNFNFDDKRLRWSISNDKTSIYFDNIKKWRENWWSRVIELQNQWRFFRRSTSWSRNNLRVYSSTKSIFVMFWSTTRQ